jgi:predicted dehydrogenase
VRPRLGFLGVGWIGRHRLEAILQSDAADVVAVADIAPENAAAAVSMVPAAKAVSSLDELLSEKLDGVVIATPSALHAEQAIAALERGVAVFCQKPLARTASETGRIIDAARRVDRLLGVDLSYRYVEGVRLIRELVGAGELGRVYAVDLVFHNAYGPDKQWFYDPARSGGGCLIDLGVHLADLALWVLEPASVRKVSSHLFARGKPLKLPTDAVEDFALAELELSGGTVARLACSWNLPAGCDAVIQAAFFGDEGGAMLSNVDGSFYDFRAERFRGTTRQQLCGPPDAWGGRAIVEWARHLGIGSGFDPAAERLVDVAAAIDAAYGRATSVELAPGTPGAVLHLAEVGAP